MAASLAIAVPCLFPAQRPCDGGEDKVSGLPRSDGDSHPPASKAAQDADNG